MEEAKNKQEPQQAAKEAPAKEHDEDFRHIVRIANTDLDGNKKLQSGLRKIKGVNFMFSNLICTLSGVDGTKTVGKLTDQEIKKLDEVINDPIKSGAPEWMLNRRKDPEDGTVKHIISSDLTFNQENDVKMMRKIKCYRGVRHSLGLPTRGQRTKANFRRNKGKVHLGVKKKEGAKAGRP